jgi:hypothetical protein
MCEGFQDSHAEPFIFCHASLSGVLTHHCLEKVFVEHKVDLWPSPPHLEGFD